MASGNIHINNQYVTIEIPTENIHGQGGENSPELSISVKFDNPARNNQKFQLLAASARLLASEKGIKVSVDHQTFSYLLREKEPFYVHFRFPLSQQIMTKVERYRMGNIKFVMDCNIQLGEYESLAFNGPKNERIEKSFLTNVVTGSGQIQFEVEQSQWVSKILPSLGMNKTTLIEIPSYTEVVPDEYKLSVAELQEATRYFSNGDYDKAVGHCRAALEPFKKKMAELKDHIRSSHQFQWLEDISAATETWLDKLLRQTYHFTGATHHTPSMGHFDRTDAEIIIMITTGIIGFVGKSGFKIE
jgi:hypothetical protein